jgi:hypothetical protein
MKGLIQEVENGQSCGYTSGNPELIEDIMKKLALAALLCFSGMLWAGVDPSPAEYKVNIHVSASRMTFLDSRSGGQQELNVVIDGKKYELKSSGAPNVLFALGDYKAKLVHDSHQNAYDSDQVYEFLLPGNKTRKFRVIGQTE